MQTRIVAVGFLAGGLLLGACSSSPSTSTSPSTPTTSQSRSTTTSHPVPDVSQYLLTIGDFPTGWSVDNSQASNSSGCYTRPLEQVPSLSYAKANFAKGGGLPELAQELGHYSSGPSRVLDDHHDPQQLQVVHHDGADGTSAKGTLGAMSFPSSGDQSAAYTATLDIEGFNVNQGLVIVRKGNYLTLIALGDIGSLDSATLQQYVTKAVAKLPT